MNISTETSSYPAKRIAAIDLGTNSFHGIIVDIYPDGSFRTIDKLKEMVLLAEKGFDNQLSDAAIERGVEALHKIKLLCDHQNVEKIIAYATSAIREAHNGGDFIQRVIDDIKFKPLAISGKKEAGLIGRAVRHAVALNGDTALMMDVGGGSVEFILGDRDTFYYTDSKKLGVARCTAKFVDEDPITADEIKTLEEHFKKELAPVAEAFARNRTDLLIGSSGTMENLADIIAARKGVRTSVTVNEFEYSADDFMELYDDMIGMTAEERSKISGLDSKRIDIINPGLVLVKFMIDQFGIKRIKTSTEALREGMILHYIEEEMQEELDLISDHPDPRERSVFELLRKTDWHEQHSRQVAKIGLRLFDELSSLHGLEAGERELFYFACLLHDIGYYISHRKHHKHALYLIRNSDLRGFSQREIEIMANVARYHRRSTPKKRHKYYRKQNEDVQLIIRKLSGLMRVADGLDRSHYQNVHDLHVDIDDKKITISLDTETDAALEVWGAMRKKKLFEEEYERELNIEVI